MKAVLYCRVDGPQTSFALDAIKGQQLYLMDYAKKNNIEIAGIYLDVGYHGRTMDRPGLQAVIQTLKEGNADVILVANYRADNVGVAVLVLPAVLDGKAHTIQQHSIQQLSVPGHLLEQISLDQCLRHTVKAVSICFQTFEIRVLHVNSSPPVGLDLHYWK